MGWFMPNLGSQNMKKIIKYSGGRKIANQIVEEWKLIYRRRSAMMDELRKAGF